MVRTRSELGNDNHQPESRVIERAPEVAVAPEPITMAGVHAMIQMMLDRQMEETWLLLQRNKDELTMHIGQVN